MFFIQTWGKGNKVSIQIPKNVKDKTYLLIMLKELKIVYFFAWC